MKKVDQFRYLGATVTSNGDCTTDIPIRTATTLSVMRVFQVFSRTEK